MNPILSVATKAQVIHAGLLALGAEPGAGVKFNPEFQPPTGQKLEFFLTWRCGRKTAPGAGPFLGAKCDAKVFHRTVALVAR